MKPALTRRLLALASQMPTPTLAARLRQLAQEVELEALKQARLAVGSQSVRS